MTSSPGSEPSTVAEPLAICPYLLVATGHWRNAVPSREHVCASEAEPVPVGLDTQRRLCFGDHRTCARYEEAARAYRAQVPLVPLRPIARTAPVVVDRGRQPLPGPRLGDRKTLGQAVLVVAMLAAAGALLLARIGSPTGEVAGRSGSPSAGSSASLAAVASPSPSPSTPAPTPTVAVSPSPTVKPSPSHTPKPSPTHKPSGKTYTVKPSDTLGDIATKFGTTVKVLQKLNGMGSSTVIHPGDVLKLP
jgi:LysM repeat protein